MRPVVFIAGKNNTVAADRLRKINCAVLTHCSMYETQVMYKKIFESDLIVCAEHSFLSAYQLGYAKALSKEIMVVGTVKLYDATHFNKWPELIRTLTLRYTK